MSAPNIIATDQDEDGHSTVIDDPQYERFSPQLGILYGTLSNGPVDLNKNADISAFEAHHHCAVFDHSGFNST